MKINYFYWVYIVIAFIIWLFFKDIGITVIACTYALAELIREK